MNSIVFINISTLLNVTLISMSNLEHKQEVPVLKRAIVYVGVSICRLLHTRAVIAHLPNVLSVAI